MTKGAIKSNGDYTMYQNEKSVNGVIDLIVDSTMMAHDHHLGLTEERFRQAVGLVDETPEEDAYFENMGAWGKMWQSVVENAFWAGYKLGQDGMLVS